MIEKILHMLSLFSVTPHCIPNDEGDEDEDEESGFSRKFRRSSFAQAIRAAVKDFSSFGIQ